MVPILVLVSRYAKRLPPKLPVANLLAELAPFQADYTDLYHQLGDPTCVPLTQPAAHLRQYSWLMVWPQRPLASHPTRIPSNRRACSPLKSRARRASGRLGKAYFARAYMRFETREAMTNFAQAFHGHGFRSAKGRRFGPTGLLLAATSIVPGSLIAASLFDSSVSVEAYCSPLS